MFSKTQSHQKDKADIALTSPETLPLWLLLWPPYNPFLTTFFSWTDRLFLLVFKLQRSVCSYFHSCKYTVAWHWCKNEWVAGETPNFHLILLLLLPNIAVFFYCYGSNCMRNVSKNAILTAHWGWVFYFSQGLQNRVCGKFKLVWQCFFFFFF